MHNIHLFKSNSHVRVEKARMRKGISKSSTANIAFISLNLFKIDLYIYN